MAASKQRAKYSPPPKPNDKCQCTRTWDPIEQIGLKHLPGKGTITHLYPYYDAEGNRVMARYRIQVTDSSSPEYPKTFRYCPHNDTTSAELKALLYGLPRLKEAIRTHAPRVYWPEGEGDCEAAWALADEYATTAHTGWNIALEHAEHFRGYDGIVYIVVDKDHEEEKHKTAAAKAASEGKEYDFPGSKGALLKWRALKAVGVKVFFREAAKGKDLRDHLEAGKTVDQLRKVTLDQIKSRAPLTAGTKGPRGLKLHDSDKPEGPAMARFVEALERKGFHLEKIGPTRYKTSCPHPDHDDRNPSFEFQQGDKGVAMTCQSAQCNYQKEGTKAICEALGIRVYDLFDSSKVKAAPGEKPVATESGAAFAPDASDPMEVARHIADEFEHEDGSYTLMVVDDDIWLHNETHWEAVKKSRLEGRLWRRMDKELVQKLVEGEWKTVRWAPTEGKVGNLTRAILATNMRNEAPEFNSWIESPMPGIHVPLANGILDVAAGVLRPNTPRYFNTWSLPFDYDPEAECPGWVEFLNTVFEGDPESVRLVKQYFGYIISGRTDLEKILLIVGPTRSGKGTIGEMLEAMVGAMNYEGFTLKSLSEDFGLQNLVGKSVMVDSDARSALKSEDMQTAIERLLSISSNDKVIVNRKNKLPISVRLGVRPVIMSNELPSFMDSSNAINDRMVLLKMRKSFLGKEDKTLKPRLRKEVQGVFNWALEGLADLEEAGRLIQPSSANNYIDTLNEGSSPHEQFLRTFCTIGAPGDEDSWCHHSQLVMMWKNYCEANDMKPGNPNWLPRKLAPIVTRLGGEMGKGFVTEDGAEMRVITGISINESTGPKIKAG